MSKAYDMLSFEAWRMTSPIHSFKHGNPPILRFLSSWNQVKESIKLRSCTVRNPSIFWWNYASISWLCCFQSASAMCKQHLKRVVKPIYSLFLHLKRDKWHNTWSTVLSKVCVSLSTIRKNMHQALVSCEVKFRLPYSCEQFLTRVNN